MPWGHCLVARSSLRRWRAWHAEQLEAALAGPDGNVVCRITEILADLTPGRMPALLEIIRQTDWRLVRADARFVLLHEIDSAIIALRERQGRPPFDDALEGEEPTLFLLVRHMLSGDSRENPAGGIRQTRWSRVK